MLLSNMSITVSVGVILPKFAISQLEALSTVLIHAYLT